jgi:hypothetical protein
MPLLNIALQYEKIGWFVLPIDSKEKKPLVKWAFRKHRRPTPKEITKWFSKFSNARIGIATGSMSGIDAVDLDGPEAIEKFDALFGIPETLIANTGRPEGGQHLIFTYTEGLQCHNGDDGIDLKTTGGFIIVEPSKHKSGKQYQWLNFNPIEDGITDILPMPADVFEHFKEKTRPTNPKDKKPITIKPAPVGQRHQHLVRMVGKWINQGLSDELIDLAARGWYESLPDKSDFTIDELEVQVADLVKRYRKPKTNGVQFPYQVMTGAAGYFSDVMSDHVEVPPQFFFMAYLTCLGSVVSPRLTLRSLLDSQPRLYTLLVGESATDRKSTCIILTVRFFKKHIIDLKIHYGIGSAEGLQELVGDDESDFTPKSLLLVFDEFKSFTDKSGIKNSILLPAINTLYEINVFENATKKSHVNIQNAHISLLAATTLETYENIYDPKFIQIGFPNRVFMVTGTAEKQYAIPPTIPENEEKEMRDHLVKVLNHVGAGMELSLTPDALEYYERWYLTMSDSVHAKRLDTYSVRLAMLLAVNNLKHEIDLETVQKATALCDWQLEVRRLHDPIQADSEINRMEQKVRRYLGNGPMTDRDLKRATNYHKTSVWVWENALKNLTRQNEIVYDKSSRVWEVGSNFILS